MCLLPHLASLFFPACAGHRAAGLAVPAAIEAAATRQPRISLQASYPSELRADDGMRRRPFNFADPVLAATEPHGANGALSIIYSRGVHGSSDCSVNRARVHRWPAALDRRVAVADRR